VGSATYVVSAEGVEIGAAPAGRRRGNHAPTCPLPVLEIGLGHFPTAVFLHRIVEVEHAPGDVGLALEEDMSPVRGGKAGPLPVATVAAICDEDKRRALDRVLDATGFDGVVEEAVSASSKARGDFSIVIKPNFMFAYDKRDQSTFTHPELVAHLVGHLRGRGFRNITVAESHSTYGEYFEILKLLLPRARPMPFFGIAPSALSSFPSGHALFAVSLYGTLAWQIASRLTGACRRAGVWVGASVLILAIGSSRVYLGVHYLSDVLAGYAAGIAWASAVLLAASARTADRFAPAPGGRGPTRTPAPR
jgi:membrane-associated phospholipid phosphatase